MREKCIQATGLTKSFGGRKVVEGLSFQVYRGEAFALLGHNGAGKSTTIDLMLGLKAPDEGSATILGMEASENRRRVFEKVGVQAIMKWLPLGIGIDSLKKISVDCYNNLAVPLAVLAAIATVCTIAAVKTFRWE